MIKKAFIPRTSEGALRWMLDREMIVRRTTKDSETYATVQGFILSDQLRDQIGSNLVKLVARVTQRRNGSVCKVSVRDAFLTATIAAVSVTARARLGDDEMARCCNVAFALLPISRLEEAGLADRSLSTIARSRSSVEKLQRLLQVRACSIPRIGCVPRPHWD